MRKISKVFVSHWPPLTDRRAFLEKTLRELRLDAEWVTKFDKRTLDPDLVSKFYRFDPELTSRKVKHWLPNGSERRPLTPAEIANAITHAYFFQQIVEQEHETTLILEDDLVPVPDFRIRLERYLDQLPDDWDIFYPGSGMDSHLADATPEKNVYRVKNSRHRAADCYLVSLKAAKRILPSLLPFSWPIDVELDHWQNELELNVYWGEPSLAIQGTEFGIYPTSVPSRGY